MLELFSYHLSYTDIFILVLGALLIGMGKTGVAGAGMIAIPLIAIIFGGKASTGILLPILIFADLLAVHHYHRHASWHHLWRLLPFVVIGIVIGTLYGNLVDDKMFRAIMAIIIFVSLGIMVWQQQSTKPKTSSSHWFVLIVGLLGGFTTMVGNLAAPILTLYLLAMKLPKNQFVATGAWFFLIVNVLKVPFHVFVWETITFDSFLLDLILIPAIAAGAYLGIRIVRIMPETTFRWFVIGMTGVAAVAMLV